MLLDWAAHVADPERNDAITRPDRIGRKDQTGGLREVTE